MLLVVIVERSIYFDGAVDYIDVDNLFEKVQPKTLKEIKKNAKEVNKVFEYKRKVGKVFKPWFEERYNTDCSEKLKKYPDKTTEDLSKESKELKEDVTVTQSPKKQKSFIKKTVKVIGKIIEFLFTYLYLFALYVVAMACLRLLFPLLFPGICSA